MLWRLAIALKKKMFLSLANPTPTDLGPDICVSVQNQEPESSILTKLYLQQQYLMGTPIAKSITVPSLIINNKLETSHSTMRAADTGEEQDHILAKLRKFLSGVAQAIRKSNPQQAQPQPRPQVKIENEHSLVHAGYCPQNSMGAATEGNHPRAGHCTQQGKMVASGIKIDSSSLQESRRINNAQITHMDNQQMLKAERLFANAIADGGLEGQPNEQASEIQQQGSQSGNNAHGPSGHAHLAGRTGRSQKDQHERPLDLVSANEDNKQRPRAMPKKVGRFSPHEQQQLISALYTFLLQHNVDLEELVNFVSDHSQPGPPHVMRLWTRVCSELGGRPVASSYRHLQRKLSIKNRNGRWTQQEQQRLVSLHGRLGNRWSAIARELDRTADNVRDKYRQIEKASTQALRGGWTIEQLVVLLQRVQSAGRVQILRPGIEQLLPRSEHHNRMDREEAQVHKYNSRIFTRHNNRQVLKYVLPKGLAQVDRRLIGWKQIAEAIASRSEGDCKNKYAELIRICLRDHSEHEARVISFMEAIFEGKGEDQITEDQIDWAGWSDEQITVGEARAVWRLMRARVRNLSELSLSQIIRAAREQVIRKSHRRSNSKRAKQSNQAVEKAPDGLDPAAIEQLDKNHLIQAQNKARIVGEPSAANQKPGGQGKKQTKALREQGSEKTKIIKKALKTSAKPRNKSE